MLQIAVTGKPNVGKSSFFNSATASKVEMANYPFTTIDANKAIAHVITECPCKELEVTCNPRNSQCIDGKRLIPIELIDVAGLVPGAHEGKGLGNKFLDDLMQAKVFIHVIDASGSTDEEGNPVDLGSHDPLDDIEFLEHEIVMWMYGIVNRNWVRLIRKVEAEHLDISKVIFDQLSGTGIAIEDIIEAMRKVDSDYTKWEEEDLINLVRHILNIAKPSLVIANKADLPGAKENIERIREKYPNVIATSAESELALVNAAKAGLISYVSGDSSFELIEKDKLNPNQIKALEYIQTNILDVYGSTGIQNALNNKVTMMNVVGYDMKSSRLAIEIAKRYDFIYAAVGIGPNDCLNTTDEDLKELDSMLTEDKVVALGEIGLDYYWDDVPKDRQQEIFQRILQ